MIDKYIFDAVLGVVVTLIFILYLAEKSAKGK
jgi:hypothetical protein